MANKRKENYTENTDAEQLLEEIVNPEYLELEELPELDTESILGDIKESLADVSPKSRRSVKNLVRPEPNAQIQCISLFYGKLIYKNKRGTNVWGKFGATNMLTFAEIEDMKADKETYLTRPYIILNDANAIEYFNLTETYNKVSYINKLDTLFAKKDLDKIREAVTEAMSVGMRDVVVAKVRKMCEDGTLDSKKILDLLTEVLGIDIE